MDTAIVPIQPDLPADIPALLDHLAETQPTVALAIAHALGSESMPALRPTVRRVTEVLESDACLDEEIEFIVSRAVTAQETFENWSDDRIDALLFESVARVRRERRTARRRDGSRDRHGQGDRQDDQEPVCQPDSLRITGRARLRKARCRSTPSDA